MDYISKRTKLISWVSRSVLDRSKYRHSLPFHERQLIAAVQFENIQRLRYFVDGLNRREKAWERKRPNPSTFSTFARAAMHIREPTIKITNPTAHKTFLSFNDTTNHPDRSLKIDVEIKKVVSSAAIKSMKSMSTASYVGITGKNAGTQFEKDLESQSRLLGGGSQVSQHVPNNNLANSLTRETGYYAVKPTGEFISKEDQAKGKGKGRESGVGEKVDRQDRIEKQKDELDTVYFYGGTIVDTLRLENGTGKLAGENSGMEIVHFGKRSAVSPFPSAFLKRTDISSKGEVGSTNWRRTSRSCTGRIRRIGEGALCVDSCDD